MITASHSISRARFHKRLTGLLALLTLAWVVLLIVSEAKAGPASTVLDYARRFNNWPVLHAIIYLNAGLLTLVTATLMLTWLLRRDKVCSTACVLAFAATVIYGVLNSVAYFSQVFVVPCLVKQVYTSAQAELIVDRLAMWLQLYPGSTIATLNQVAYSMLAVPSLIVGRWMLEESGKVRAAGWSLIISGVLSVIAAVGVLVGVSALGVLSLVSGVVFLVALVLRWLAY